MKNLLTGIFITLLALTTIGTGAFGYLFITKNNEVVTLNSKITDLNKQVDDLKNQPVIDPAKCPTAGECKHTFTDSGFGGVSVAYPDSWKATLNTNIDTENIYEPKIGKIIDKYSFVLTKGSSVLTFNRSLLPMGFFPDGAKKSTSDIVEITSKVIRISEKGKNEWRYVATMDCSGASSPDLGDFSGFDYCYMTPFPGFGKENGAAFVDLKSSVSADILEADAIVKSAIN